MTKHAPPLLISLAVLGLWIGACGGDSASDDGNAHITPPPAAPTAPSPAPAASGPTGNSAVAGKIVFDGEPPRLPRIKMDADPVCAAKHDGPVFAEILVLGDGQSLGNVFVQVTNPPAGTYPAPATAAVVDQNGCLYSPRVLGVMAGQALQFKNSDGLLHNVHGRPQKNREFNMGMPPTLTETETTLSRPEPMFPVKCDVHPWMQAFVAVMDHPFFSVSDASGEYRIEGLPAGEYEIEAWHEKLGTHTSTVTIGDGETGTADFTFAVPSRG
ncbi:MAG: carboxypeptidase regulatory-like domain-containing protein [Thermoanaerobaculia bacterium]